MKENEEKVGIDLTFKNLDLNEPLEIIYTTVNSNQNDINTYLKQLNAIQESNDLKPLNISNAIQNVDFVFLNIFWLKGKQVYGEYEPIFKSDD